MKSLTVHEKAELFGQVTIPGDKSISHRALMFASIAKGSSEISNLLEGHDCMATLQLLRALSVHIELKNERWLVHGQGRFGFSEPSSILDCKNSGTTIRLMAGLLSGMPFMSVLDGSEQIKNRPMGRVIDPLQKMAARIYGREHDKKAPLVTLPSTLLGIDYDLPVKSAQVKSALILAGLYAKGPTLIRNSKSSRDHSERLLAHMGAQIESFDDHVAVKPLEKELAPFSLRVPGDISSAAFLLVAGALCAKPKLVLKDVGVNHSRTGIIDALKKMGGEVYLHNEHEVAGEPVADIEVRRSSLKGAIFGGDDVVRMIDEIPVLALLATQAEGQTVIKDAQELRVKESDRIGRTVELLKSLGAHIEGSPDGMIIEGPSPLKGATVSSFGDHRLALTMAIAALVSESPMSIRNAEVTDDSFPGFVRTLRELGAHIEEH
jgi:3-phosphoshikimate 1-carboxyvinyltransferase